MARENIERGGQPMRIYVTSVLVDDQEKALKFYTDSLGFVKKHDIPLGEHRRLTVVAAAEPDGPELLLEPDAHPAAGPVSAPSAAELEALVRSMAERIGRSLERAGLITRDLENAYLAFDPSEEAPINTLLGHSITYRIATGPREGQKVFTLFNRKNQYRYRERPLHL
jgi:catechol 2,3-dioxygenase-like lactoylglutathione lyase family enzyme